MGQFSFWLVVLFLAGVIAIALAVGAYLLIKYLKAIDERVELSLKVMGHNLKALKYYGSSLDELKSDSKTIIDTQGKAFDYQNVLINSLNRQLRNLDVILSDNKQLPKSNSKSANPQDKRNIQNLAPLVNIGAKPLIKRDSGKPAHSDAAKSRNSSVKNGVILLDKLLAEKRLKLAKNRVSNDKVAKLSSIFDQANPGYSSYLGATERKTSHG